MSPGYDVNKPNPDAASVSLTTAVRHRLLAVPAHGLKSTRRVSAFAMTRRRPVNKLNLESVGVFLAVTTAVRHRLRVAVPAHGLKSTRHVSAAAVSRGMDVNKPGLLLANVSRLGVTASRFGR